MRQVTTGARVALRNDSYTLHLLLPTKVDPLVSLMKVEKVPDSTYDMIGGLDQQIKEIKEVCCCCARAGHHVHHLRCACSSAACMANDLQPKGACGVSSASHRVRALAPCAQVIELPIKHPELFESLGVAQPKVRLRNCICACRLALRMALRYSP